MEVSEITQIAKWVAEGRTLVDIMGLARNANIKETADGIRQVVLKFQQATKSK
jgi:hypothetical protein